MLTRCLGRMGGCRQAPFRSWFTLSLPKRVETSPELPGKERQRQTGLWAPAERSRGMRERHLEPSPLSKLLPIRDTLLGANQR